jgi:hypothetical protein
MSASEWASEKTVYFIGLGPEFWVDGSAVADGADIH